MGSCIIKRTLLNTLTMNILDTDSFTIVEKTTIKISVNKIVIFFIMYIF